MAEVQSGGLEQFVYGLRTGWGIPVSIVDEGREVDGFDSMESVTVG